MDIFKKYTSKIQAIFGAKNYNEHSLYRFYKLQTLYIFLKK